MRSVVVLVSAIAMLLTVPAQTQEIPRKEAEDRVFGWMKIYDFKDATAPMTVDHRVYSTAQLSVANNFANWIQQSYVPVGGLGDVIRFVSEKLTAGNQETRSLPQSYGAIAKIYTDLKYGAAGKVERPRTTISSGASARTTSTANPRPSSARRSSTTSRSRSSPNRARTTATSSRRPWTSRRTRCSGGSRRISSETPAPAIRSTSCSPRTTGCRS